MEFKLHHIGIAVKQIEPVLKMLNQKFGLNFDGIENVDSQKVNVSFTTMFPAIELVEATQPNSPKLPILPHPINSFIEKKGEGLHHICFSVKNIEEAYDLFKNSGTKILGNEILVGSKSKKIFFIDPNETMGILIEIKEDKD